MTKILKKTKKEYKRKKNQYLIGHKILFDAIYSSVTLLKNRGRTALRSKHKKNQEKGRDPDSHFVIPLSLQPVLIF